MATKIDLAVSMVLDSKGVAVGFRDVKNKVRDLEGQFMKMNDTLKEVKRGTEGFQAAASTAMETYQRQTRTAGTATSNLKSKLDDLFKPITTLNQAFGLLQQSLYVVNRAFQLTVGSAIDLELQVARINTVLDESERGQVDFAKQILQMQATFGANPTEAAKGFYEAIASGATNAAGSIELMATAQRLAIGGLLPLDKALSGLTAVMASYGYTAEQTKFISDGFFIAAAKGKTNVEELTQEIGNVSSIAQQSGVSFAELAASISAVTLGGKRTAEATTSVRSAINALLTPTEQLQYVFDQLNIKSVTQEIRQRGLAAVYKDIYKYVNNNAEALSKLVGRVEAISAVVALTTGKQADAYQAMVTEINDSNRQMGDRTEQAFKTIKETSAEGLKRAKESIAASLTDISQIAMKLVVPVLTGLASVLNAVLKPIVFITDQMEKFADVIDKRVIVAVLGLSTVIVGLKTVSLPALGAIAIAMKAALAPILILTAKFIGIVSIMTLAIATIDSFVKNWELIPVAFEYVAAKFDEIKTRIFASINDLFIGLANIIENNANKFPKISELLGLSDFAKKSKSELSAVNEQFGQELDKAAKRAEDAKKKIQESFKPGAFGALKDIAKDIAGAFGAAQAPIFGPPKPSATGAPTLPSVDTKAAPDISKAIEERNKLQEQLNTMLQKTAEYEEQIRTSKIYGNDLLRESLQIEFDKIDALAQQLSKHRALTKEQQNAINQYKQTASQALEIKINDEKVKKATEFVNSAASGADALVTKTINEVSAAFGPQGQLFAGIINLLRMGKDTMKNLGSSIIQIIADLPIMIVEGAVGLIEGVIEGILKLLTDPAKLGKIIAYILEGIPIFVMKAITALAKALPQILKILFDPSFWIELVSQFIRALWDALMGMIYAIGDLIASIFSGDIFSGMKKSVEKMGDSIAEGISDATKAVTGFTQSLFGLGEDVQGKQGKTESSKIRDAFDAGAKKTRSAWDWVKKWVIDPIGKVLKTAWKIIELGWDLMVESFKTAFEVVGAVIKGTFDVIVAVFEATGDYLAAVFQGIWDTGKAIFEGIFNFFKTIFEGIFDVAKAAFTAVFDYIKAVFEGIFNFGKSIFEGIVNIFSAMWESAKKIFGAIVDAFSGVWDVIKSIFQGIIDAFKAVFEFIINLFKDPIYAFKKLWSDFKEIFSNIGESIGNLFDKIKTVFTSIWDGLKNVGTSVKDGFVDALKKLGEFFVNIGTTVWDGLKSVGEKLTNLFVNAGKSIWEGLKSVGTEIKNLFVNAGTAIWDSIKNIGSKIGESLSEVGGYLWNGIKSAFENIKNFFKDLLSFDGGGRGTVEKFLHMDFPFFAFAEGGKVPGTPKVFGDSYKNDTVAALLSPGEFVIPRSKMQDPNNLMLLDAIMSGGMMKDWIIEQQKNGVQNKAYGEWIEKAGSGGVELLGGGNILYDIGDAIASGAKKVKNVVVTGVEKTGDFLASTGSAIVKGMKKVGDFLMPDWLSDIWDGLKKFISNLDLGAFVKNPIKYIGEMLRKAGDFLVEPFKQMFGFHESPKQSDKAMDGKDPVRDADLASYLAVQTTQNILASNLAQQAASNMLKSMTGMATGGFVPGYGNKDTIPAMLTPGEFVINRNAAQTLGGGILNQLNAGRLPVAQEAPIFNINLNIETKDALDATFIRNTLIPTIKNELRASSLRGDFVLSARGVRQ